jgi:hypothetical protein
MPINLKSCLHFTLLVVIISLCLPLDSIIAPANSQSVIASSGTIRKIITWLHTENGSIKNEYGNIVQLTGVGIQEFMSGSGGVRIGNYIHDSDKYNSDQDRDYIAQYFKRIKDEGANHVRISIKLLGKWANPDEYPMYIPNLDMCVEEAAKVDLYIYFCFHCGSHYDNEFMQALIDNSAWETWDHARDAWLDAAKNIAERYQDYSNVMGFQNWGEPGWARFGRNMLDREGEPEAYATLCEEWATFNLDVAQAIHSINPKVLIFVTSPGYYAHKDVCDYYFDNPLNEPNIVYAWQDYHTYQTNKAFWKSYSSGDYSLAWEQQEEWLFKIAFRMIEKGYPVHLVEFGFRKDFSEANFEDQMAQDMYDIFLKHNMGWTQFCWGSGNSPWYLLDDDGDFTLSAELMIKNFNPNAHTKLSGDVYIALKSTDGMPAHINITEIKIVSRSQSFVDLSLIDWVMDPENTNSLYVLNSTDTNLYLENNATDINSKVTIAKLDWLKLDLLKYAYIDLTVEGSSNALILMRFFLENGNSFDVVHWQDTNTMNNLNYDLRQIT